MRRRGTLDKNNLLLGKCKLHNITVYIFPFQEQSKRVSSPSLENFYWFMHPGQFAVVKVLSVNHWKPVPPELRFHYWEWGCCKIHAPNFERDLWPLVSCYLSTLSFLSPARSVCLSLFCNAPSAHNWKERGCLAFLELPGCTKPEQEREAGVKRSWWSSLGQQCLCFWCETIQLPGRRKPLSTVRIAIC